MSKYAPLSEYLAGRDDIVHMTFDEVADLVGGLPRSAYEYTAWWNNQDSTHSHCASWNDAGYAAKPRLIERSVTFSRIT